MITGPDPVFSIAGLRHLRSQAGICFELRVPALSLFKGEFAAVVGPSGCGKSTLLDILGLVLKPLEVTSFSMAGPQGSVDLKTLGSRGQALVRSRQIGYVLQTGGLLPFLTVRRNIGLPLRLNRRRDQGLVERTARDLGIVEQLDKLPCFLSGGQRQRAAIARALIHGPSMVLADEPTAAVDELTAQEIRDQFRELSRRSGTATLMVTHDRSLLRGRVDRVFGFVLTRGPQGRTISTLREEEGL